MSKAYLSKFPGGIRVYDDHKITWPQTSLTINVSSRVYGIAFSADGKRVVSGSWDCTVRIWDAITGETVAGPFQGHTEAVRSVGFSADGKRVVSGPNDETVMIYNSGTEKTDVKLFRNAISVGLSSNGLSTPSHSRLLSFSSHDQVMSLRNDIPLAQTLSSQPMGWISDENRNILFWIPETYRAYSWVPGAISIMGATNILLNTYRFSHGASWKDCFKP